MDINKIVAGIEVVSRVANQFFGSKVGALIGKTLGQHFTRQDLTPEQRIAIEQHIAGYEAMEAQLEQEIAADQKAGA